MDSLRDKKWLVYLHTIPKEITKYENDKYYVGITSNLKRRWEGNGCGYRGQVFYNAIQKYGWENIKHEILLENLTIDEADKYEREYIALYQSYIPKFGYNMTLGGINIGSLTIPKKVACYDIDGKLVKTYYSAKDVMDETGNNAVYSVLSGHRLSYNGCMWRYFDEEPLENITPYENKQHRPVLQYDIYGNFIKEWHTCAEAEQFYHDGIYEVCMGATKTCCGYQWTFKENGREIKDISKESNFKRRIYLYTKDGKFIKEYESIPEAKKDLGIKNLQLGKKITDIRRNFSCGYRWTDMYYESLPPLYTMMPYMKPVVQIDIDTDEIINIYESATSAGKENNFCDNSISNCCNGKDKFYTAYGYKWKYLKDIKESEITDSFLLEKYHFLLEQYEYLQEKGGLYGNNKRLLENKTL